MHVEITPRDEPQSTAGEPRKRIAHKKSRRGCGNCKIRRVKCDETKPKCNKCTSYGVSCNYDGKAPDLQMSFDGMWTIKAIEKSPRLPSQSPHRKHEVPASLVSPFISSDDDTTILLDRECVERLGRFQTRTVLAIGTQTAAHLFQRESISLAASHPYLMHIIQVVTSLHDRYIDTALKSPQTVSEIYHLSQAAALFNKKLNKPIKPSDRDALWSAAALLGFLAMTWIDAATPEEAWPLAKSDPADLEWIRMSESKAAIWEIANPLRPDSMFHIMATDYMSQQELALSKPTSGIKGIPPSFAHLYDLDESSNAENNPYFNVIHELVPLLETEPDRSNIVIYYSVLSHMGLPFKSLLKQKDPRALMVFAYWYAKLIHSVWWLDRRSLMEGQAICLYLERYHGDYTELQDMLVFPKRRFGLI